MRTRSWLLALSTTVVPAAILAAGCGDSGGASGGAGGAATGTTSITVGISTGKTVSTNDTNTVSSTHATSVTTAVSSTASGTTSGTTASSTSTTSASTTSASTTSASTTSASTTSASSTSGAGGGGPSNFAFDTCAELAAAPNPITLVPLQSKVVFDAISGTSSDFSTFCDPSAAGADVVYQVNTTGECTFTADADASFNAVMSLRSDCNTRPGGTQCAAGSTQLHLAVDLAAGTNYVVIKGAATADTGNFDLTLNCAAPTCGDYVVNQGEACDSGPNPSINTGCDASCHLVSSTVSNTCPGTDLPLTATPTLFPQIPPALGPYNNAGGGLGFTPVPDNATCPFILPVAPPDAAPTNVFHVKPATSGTVSVTIGLDGDGIHDACEAPDAGCFNTGVFVRQGDCAGGTQIACGSEGTNNSGAYTVSWPATANTDYYVFVTTNDANSLDAASATGPYFLKVSIQ